jgi:ABC-type transport system involved in multi-copper enzyme maturation permease subunit
MTLANFASTTVWLTRDTYRQSLASGLCWLLLGLSTICILVCGSASVSGRRSLTLPGEHNGNFLPRFDREAHDPDKLKPSGTIVADGTLSLAFGAIRIPMARDARNAVHFVQLVLAAGIADTLGLLLALVWTAGFLPGFLDRRAIAVLLAKPIPRGALLLGKYIGVLAFVAAHAGYFVVGTWLALALRTGVWDASYLLSVPLLLLHFAVFFGVSLLLAVCTRSTVASVFGSIAFWGICWAINFGRHSVMAAAALAPEGSISPALVRLANVGYWLLPKPVDLARFVFDTLGAESSFRPVFQHLPAVSTGLSILTSLLFTGYVLFAACRYLRRVDY